MSDPFEPLFTDANAQPLRPVRVRATYEAAVRALGEPNAPFDTDKSHVEWHVQTPDGQAEVYDFGDCHDCEPACPFHPAVSPWPVEWHVQGAQPAVEHVRGLLA